jgi:hypothetical protein
LFNWTNPEEFTNKSIKPNFDEIGPFRFQEIPSKVNVTWHDENSTVSYRKQSRYFFVPDESKGRLDDVITSVNVIALVSSRFNIFSTFFPFCDLYVISVFQFFLSNTKSFMVESHKFILISRFTFEANDNAND